MSWRAAHSERGVEVRFGLAVAALAVIGLLFAEAVLRLQHRMHPDNYDWPALEKAAGVPSDGISTYRFRPGASFERITINSAGFRGPELEVPKPAGRVRIAVLGPSTVFGATLDEAATLPAQFVSALSAERPGCHFDYVSVSGENYSLADLATLVTTLPDTISIDQFVIVHSGLGHRPPNLEARERMRFDLSGLPESLASVIEKFRLFYALERLNRRPLAPSERASHLAEIKEKNTAEVALKSQELARLLNATSPVPTVFFQFTGLHREGSAELRESWHAAALTAISDAPHTRYSQALAQVPPSRRNFISGAHYSAIGTERAAIAMTRSFLELNGSALPHCR